MAAHKAATVVAALASLWLLAVAARRSRLQPTLHTGLLPQRAICQAGPQVWATKRKAEAEGAAASLQG